LAYSDPVIGNSAALAELASLCGVLTEYEDCEHVWHQASPEALVAVLDALGVSTSGRGGVEDALLRERRRRWAGLLEPCSVAWEGRGELELRVGVEVGGTYAATISGEDGETHQLVGELGDLPVRGAAGADGKVFVRRALALPELGLGYHQVSVEVDTVRSEAMIIASPLRAWGAPGSWPRTWGVFAPTYALHSRDGCGAGDLDDLTRLGEWVGENGGGVIGTLPLLSAYLDEPYESSPYSPVSKLFWNEFFLPVDDQLGEAGLAAAATLRDLPRVAYRDQMAFKRPLLEAAAARAWAERRQLLEDFIVAHPRVDDYARFRAAVERRRSLWTEWSPRQRDGLLDASDYDEAVRRYHVYVQQQMSTRLTELRHKSTALYLDLPVGVNRYGYDVWREREAFALGMAAGAPPDALFSGGQNWGFPPLHPQRLRRQGYRYLIECLRTHLEQAAMLRIDHVMGFHRLYWVPDGMPATAGVYVRYPAEELYAVHVLESHRQQCALVGEDLGTVPDVVPEAMRRHGMHRLFVVQFTLPGKEGEAMAAPPPETVASLNTHDMPTFAGFWHGREIDDRIELGLLDDDEAEAERVARRTLQRATVAWLRREGLLAPRAASGAASAPQTDAGAAGEEAGEELAGDDVLAAVMRAVTYRLAASDAQVALITLDDLWLEREPQNIPGTGWERPNWRRKMRLAIDEICADPEVARVISRVDSLRRRSKPDKSS
jgi:4-alpha-glucanotransferase